ncbi:MAG: Lrp/AsnC ligand binding domain-containing protein [Thermoproteota archaeon]
MYMGLTCKVGAYRKVLDEILELDIPKGNTFLLFGPIDILIQFTGLNNLDQFIKEWFSTIRGIGAKEGLISRSITLPVIHEGPLFAEEPYAFTFMHVTPSLEEVGEYYQKRSTLEEKVRPTKLEKVQRTLLEMPKVLSADTVFGPYDVICAIRAENNDDLERTISTIHNKIPGIEGIITAITADTKV